MVRIFNKKLGLEIIIDSHPNIQLEPKLYDDNPSLRIQMKYFDFSDHARKCKDCGGLMKDFGTETLNWYMEYGDTIFRLDLRTFGKGYSSNEFKRTISYFDEDSSFLKLMVNREFPASVNELNELRFKFENQENYEKCAIIRDLIDDLE